MASYETTPLGEVTEQCKKDMDLIKADALLQNWDGVVRGIRWNIDALTDILQSIEYLQRRGAIPSKERKVA